MTQREWLRRWSWVVWELFRYRADSVWWLEWAKSYPPGDWSPG